MFDRHITEVAAAVTDGEAIDWTSVKANLDPRGGHDVVTELEALSELRPATPTEAARALRLPITLEAIRIVAIAGAFVGATVEIGRSFAGGMQNPVFTLVLLAFAGAALYLDLGGRDLRARALAVCYWIVAASFSADTFRWLTVQSGDAAWMRMLTAIRPEAFFAAGLWLFAREFPAVTRFTRLDRVSVAALRLTTSIGVTLFAVNVAIGLAPASRFAVWAAPLNAVRVRLPYWNIIIVPALAAIVTIGMRARAAQGFESRRARVFLYAIVCSFLPLFLEIVAESLVPGYGRLMRKGTTGRFIGSLIIYPLQIALPFVTAYAVVVDNVLDVQVAVQRGLRYLLAKTLVAWGAAVPLAGLLLYVYVHRDQPLSESLATGQARLLVWIGAVALMLLSLRPMLVRALDRWALPGMEDGSTMLATMAASLKNTRTRIEVVTALMMAAERALQTPAEGYLWRDGRLASIRPAAAPPPEDSVIAVLLEGARGPCVVSPDHRQSYYRLLTNDDRRWIAVEKIAVLVPVMASRGRGGLVGIVALKDRRNAITFSQDDLRFLSAASASASLASDVLEAEEQTPQAGAATAHDELAMQCARCGRVAAWTPNQERCLCGGAWEQAALPHQLMQRYTITAKLGAGGMGIVYRATDIALQRDVAVKTLTRLSEDAAARLMTEARTMAGLSHVNIAVLYGAEAWRNTPLLVMEYLSGGTLAARLRKSAMPRREAIAFARTLASTLDHLHRAGMYHGDIKPSNIGFSADGTPKFLDFGLTRAIAGTAVIAAGTPAYMPTDMHKNDVPGPALDVWALSIVFGECLTGERHPPFQSRPQTAGELLAALEGFHD